MEKKVNRVCLLCHSEFVIYKSSLTSSNASGNFCKRECYNKYLKTLTGDKHNRYNKVKLNCDECHKEILVIPARIKMYDNHFCSKECKQQFHIGKFAGEKNPTWKGGHIKRKGNFNSVKSKYFKYPQNCALCGTTKKVHIHHIIPFRFTQDNSLSNLIPLCIKHHRQIEILTYKIISEKNLILCKYLLNNVLRSRQLATFTLLKEIKNGRQITN